MAKYVPIKIYKNGQFLVECESIQKAGAFLQEETGDKYKRFTAIERGYCFGEPFDINGARYTFEAPTADKARRSEEIKNR